MCAIAGFFHPERDFTTEKEKWTKILEKMNEVQRHRGPDDEGIFLSNACGLAHVRLTIIDLITGKQPMIKRSNGRECAIVFNGEIYNMHELKQELLAKGAKFETTSDTEVILLGYMYYGKDFIKQLNGIFSVALWD